MDSKSTFVTMISLSLANMSVCFGFTETEASIPMRSITFTNFSLNLNEQIQWYLSSVTYYEDVE